jgi:hypothetical protein
MVFPSSDDSTSFRPSSLSLLNVDLYHISIVFAMCFRSRTSYLCSRLPIKRLKGSSLHVHPRCKREDKTSIRSFSSPLRCARSLRRSLHRASRPAASMAHEPCHSRLDPETDPRLARPRSRPAQVSSLPPAESVQPRIAHC